MSNYRVKPCGPFNPKKFFLFVFFKMSFMSFFYFTSWNWSLAGEMVDSGFRSSIPLTDIKLFLLF